MGIGLVVGLVGGILYIQGKLDFEMFGIFVVVNILVAAWIEGTLFCTPTYFAGMALAFSLVVGFAVGVVSLVMIFLLLLALFLVGVVFTLVGGLGWLLVAGCKRLWRWLLVAD